MHGTVMDQYSSSTDVSNNQYQLFSSGVKQSWFISTDGLRTFQMDSEQPKLSIHQSTDHERPVFDRRVIHPSTPLPSRCRTFRMSEIPLDMDKDTLCQCLDHLQVGPGCIKGNSKIFSLAIDRRWQIATVSFHQEPEVFEGCKPGKVVHLQLPKRQVRTVSSPQEPEEYKRCKPDREAHLQLLEQQIETRAVPVCITIDCDFYSMTPLYEPVGTTVKYDIIAVTGLSAHAFGSWKSPDQAHRMWLRDFLHLEFPDIRVLTWGYHSSIRDDRSTTSVTAISRNFLLDIKQTVSRPLILIGHSLGGLVLQKALVDASKSNSAEDKAFHQACVGVLFFGVPNRGLNPKSIDTLVQGKRNERFLEDLSHGSNYLYELETDFRICHESMKGSIIVSFYESEDTYSVQMNGNYEKALTRQRELQMVDGSAVVHQFAWCLENRQYALYRRGTIESKFVQTIPGWSSSGLNLMSITRES
ncbi:hypothetical protein FPQ18DRAFT_307335 [Pyronema domesticum]|nr:hypothetical protein FPQ18DRAFT_307335 [Pyronema domesticum]